MKLFPIFVASVAIIAIAACSAEKDKGPTQVASAPVKPVAPPASGDWSEVVSATPEGGFIMGNPAAAVKLVEFGSLTCSHCAEFSEKSDKALTENYVKSGRVSFEFRSYMRNGLDIAATLIAACNGPKSFFPIAHAMYGAQADWLGRVAGDAARQEAIANLPPAQQFAGFAKLAGLDSFAAMRGVPSAKSAKCLADEAAVSKLVQQTSDATAQYNIPGTPTFLINGEVVKDTAAWELLEPKLKVALGG